MLAAKEAVETATKMSSSNKDLVLTGIFNTSLTTSVQVRNDEAAV
jgi:hypothetical protein